MKTLRRWSYRTGCYEPHEIPDEWDVSAGRRGFDDVINCASCGAELPVRETYVSKEIHDRFGFGFYVCKGCYVAEWKRQIEAKAKEA